MTKLDLSDILIKLQTLEVNQDNKKVFQQLLTSLTRYEKTQLKHLELVWRIKMLIEQKLHRL